jgi:hypothetical protein
MKLLCKFRFSWLPLICAAALGALAVGCDRPADTATPDTAAHRPSASSDTRLPLPLLPHMAEHQLANMRDHLAVVQEVVSALAAKDFEGVERAASRIASSEQMSRMCNHMGLGAPGFTELALNFHRTADGIGEAAKQRDADATLKAVSATLQTCVGCHTTYRQKIVDAATWEKITKQP